MGDEFDGYRKWLGITSRVRPPDHYSLLGIALDEEDEEVIQAAIDQRRQFVESKRGQGHDESVEEILYQIAEAEVTLFNVEMRRKYDRQMNLWEKRRKNRQVDPHASRSKVKSRSGKSVGEDGGIVKTFAGIMALICVGFGIMAWFSFQLPWSKKVEQVKPTPIQEVQVPAPIKIVEQERPKEVVVDDATAKVMLAIQGEWILFASEIKGKPFDAKQRILVIEGNMLKPKHGEQDHVDNFVLNATNGHFDYSLQKKNGDLKDAIGIYQFDGDTLKLCYRYNVDGTAVRPTEFKTDDGQPNTTVFHTLKRFVPIKDDGPTPTMNLEELNSSDVESSPFLSTDGMEIFWVVGKRGANSEDNSIWTARRKTSDSLFTDKKQLYAGHAPVLSSDGLQLFFRSSDGETIKSASRKSRNDEFGRPRSESSLTFLGQDAAPRWLTNDGLTLYLDMKVEGGPHHAWEVIRTNVDEDWGHPKLVKAAFEGMPDKFRFTQVSGAQDNLSLFCVVNFPPKGVRVGVLSRNVPTGPFTKWTEIQLKNQQEQYPLCLRPTFVPATNELFLASSQLFSDPASADKRSMDLWVIKRFRPPSGN